MTSHQPLLTMSMGAIGDEGALARNAVAWSSLRTIAEAQNQAFERLMLRPLHPGVAIRPLANDPPSRRVSALRLSTRYLTAATERFLALLVAASADYSRTHSDHS